MSYLLNDWIVFILCTSVNVSLFFLHWNVILSKCFAESWVQGYPHSFVAVTWYHKAGNKYTRKSGKSRCNQHFRAEIQVFRFFFPETWVSFTNHKRPLSTSNLSYCCLWFVTMWWSENISSIAAIIHPFCTKTCWMVLQQKGSIAQYLQHGDRQASRGSVGGSDVTMFWPCVWIVQANRRGSTILPQNKNLGQNPKPLLHVPVVGTHSECCFSPRLFCYRSFGPSSVTLAPVLTSPMILQQRIKNTRIEHKGVRYEGQRACAHVSCASDVLWGPAGGDVMVTHWQLLRAQDGFTPYLLLLLFMIYPLFLFMCTRVGLTAFDRWVRVIFFHVCGLDHKWSFASMDWRFLSFHKDRFCNTGVTLPSL